MASKAKTSTSNLSSKKRPKEEAPSTSKGTSTPKKSKQAPKDDDWDEPGSATKEKPKANSFWKFKQRQAPTALGSKEIPQGPEDCLVGLDFVVTGVLSSIQREEAEDLIKRHGGLVKSGVSKKTSYLVVGLEPGESKMKKAKELKTKVIDEDGLFELIRNATKSKPASSNGNVKARDAQPLKKTTPTKPVGHASKKSAPEIILLNSDEEDAQPVQKKQKREEPSGVLEKKMAAIFFPKSTPVLATKAPSGKPTKEVEKQETKSVSKNSRPADSPVKVPPRKPKMEAVQEETKPVVKREAKSPATKSPVAVPDASSSSQPSGSANTLSPATARTAPMLLWVDKYAPKFLKQVVGQHTPASPANKILHWLTHWHENRKKHGYKATSAGFFPKAGGDGSEFKAALLSGPPGLGKTTTATLACKEAGFTFIHLNASDSRSKKILDAQIKGGATGYHSLYEWNVENAVKITKSAIIMDEVDGMAGNEDRGGMAEVIQLIRNAKVPVICICNDRSSQKIRSLSAYCFDLRFQRPRLEQIRGAMLSVCAKEGIRIAPNALDVIIQGAHQDIRQTLHNLYSWTITKKSMTYDEAKTHSVTAEKDSIKVGPFEACRAMFQAPKGRLPGSLVNEKMDLYFEDYSFVPLFVQENYLNVQPHNARDVYHSLDLISKTADSFSLSDLVDREIRSRQNWSLLPIHAVFTAVIPGNVMQGHLQGMIQFPGWLGKNSTTNKNKRIIEDLRAHMHLRISSDVPGLHLDYLPVMRRALTLPLKRGEEGIEQVVNFVNSYDLLREDIEPIMEVTTWEGMKDPLKDIPSTVKAALTRQLNKGTHQNPYSNSEMKKGRAKASDGATELMDEETKAALAVPEDDDVVEDDNVEKDASIKVKKPRAAAASKSRAGPPAAASTSARGRGGGRGKAATPTTRRGKK